MKQFLKVVFGIVILAGVLYGIYIVVPEYPHNMIKSFIQPITDAHAKMRIEQVQNMSVGIKELEGLTYKMAVEKNTGMSCWVYEQDELTGNEVVKYYGKGAAINLKDFPDYNGKLYTGAVVKFEFVISGNNVEILPYVDGVKMNITGGASKERNKEILKSIVSQMYSGMQPDQ
ncbi:MAG: hypothetical protein IJ661_05145 [Lachnospiraceae bacterium]|nr:hypothetical protein [Lachnospiraceae bacterium]